MPRYCTIDRQQISQVLSYPTFMMKMYSRISLTRIFTVCILLLFEFSEVATSFAPYLILSSKSSTCPVSSDRGDATIHFSSRPSDLPTDDPRIEPRVVYEITLSLPMGLILEEMDACDSTHGVVIVGILPGGNAAKSNGDVFASNNIMNRNNGAVKDKCICIRDKIMSINGKPCHDKSFDEVMDFIQCSNLSSKSNSHVTMQLGRLQGSTVLHYSCNDNRGVCIAAKAGESYGFLAQRCGVDIDYNCRNGSCLTCQRWMHYPDKVCNKENMENNEEKKHPTVNTRTIFNCIGKVPRNYEWLHIFDSVDHVSNN
mmetsp:Transcript_31831/g.65360  ORF Transcript_31831/g.65360 Transcript_31831/m.65360 type:complete len:313 (+) Transcript_31831:94-1032(+)